MIYLIGPYTSTSLGEHRMNIGRLYAYYIQLHKDISGAPVICWPLMTAGFEQILPDRDHQWIKFCTDFIESGVVSSCYVVPGHKESAGCRMEIECALRVGIELVELPPFGWYTQSSLVMDLMELRNRNEFARWAMQWMAML